MGDSNYKKGMKQYFKKRRVAAFMILGAGILVAFLLVISPSSGEKPFISVVQNPNTGKAGYGVENEGGLSDLNSWGIGTSTAADRNLTQTLAQHYVESVYNLNSGNPTDTTDTLRMPPSGSMDDFLTQALSQDLSFPSFSEKDIRTGKDGSIQAQTNYLNAIGSITQKNFGSFSMSTTDILSAFFNKSDSAPLAKYINIINGQVNDLLALEAPPQWKVWHLQNLNLWAKKSVVYTAVLDFKNDPLKATIALNDVRSVLEENIMLQNVLSNQANTLNKK